MLPRSVTTAMLATCLLLFAVTSVTTAADDVTRFVDHGGVSVVDWKYRILRRDVLVDVVSYMEFDVVLEEIRAIAFDSKDRVLGTGIWRNAEIPLSMAERTSGVIPLKFSSPSGAARVSKIYFWSTFRQATEAVPRLSLTATLDFDEAGSAHVSGIAVNQTGKSVLVRSAIVTLWDKNGRIVASSVRPVGQLLASGTGFEFDYAVHDLEARAATKFKLKLISFPGE